MEKPFCFQTVTPPLDIISLVKTDPYLVVDTSLYPPEFQAALLTHLSRNLSDGLDAATDGLLIHSDNFQALNLLQARYREQVKCIYIDPPYNANSSIILYKNTFKHAAWLTMMENRVTKGKIFLNNDGTQAIAIDEVEQELLGQLLNSIFAEWEKACLSITHNPRGQQGKNISYTHEFCFLLYPNDNKKFISDVKRLEIDSRNLRDSGTESDRTDAKNCFYPFFIKNGKIIGVGDVPSDNFHPYPSNIKNKDGIIEIWPINDAGEEKKWRYAKQSVEKIIDKLEPKQGRKNIQIIFNKDTGVMRSLWADAKYDASEYGTKVIQSILGEKQAKYFSYPKSIHTVTEIISAQIGEDIKPIILDYFAGSGTTAHAVINLNREDDGKRKYILVEQAEYFNTVLKPRVQKVIYSKEWKDGKPQADGDGNFHGVPQIVKVLKLESYEDTLNNLQLNRTKKPKLFEDGKPTSAALNKTVVQDYLLHYMLDMESRDSLLSSDDFRKPFDYRLNIASDSAGAYTQQLIDLVETFNYLLGLQVDSVEDRRHNKGYVFIKGQLKGERVLLVWRDCERWDYDGLQQLLEKKDIKPQKNEFAEIYINGDHTWLTVWQDNDADDGSARTLKIRSIEEEFLRLMFEEDK